MIPGPIFRNTSGGGSSSGRELLTGNRTYYVRTDGSDSNTGLVDSSGGAFLTIQKAIDTAAGLDLGIYDVTIDVGNGTYTDGAKLKSIVGSGCIHLLGDTTTPSNVVISATSEAALGSEASGDDFYGNYSIRGFKLQTTTSGSCLTLGGRCSVAMSAMDFGTCAARHIELNRYAALTIDGNYSITGAAAYHWLGFGQAYLTAPSITITITGTPAFSGNFAYASDFAFLRVPSITFSGGATGTRYLATLHGVINTSGGGATYLPGNGSGSTSNGGAYY